MRAVWVDEGQTPDWTKLSKHGITWVFLSLRERDLGVRLEAIRDRGLTPGVYAAWNWYPGLTGGQFAERVHRDLADRAPGSYVRVQLNDETHDPARITAMLRRWRELRPTTPTSWTLEGHQGGWFAPALVKTIIDTKVRVVPQAYTGPMQPTCPLACVRDITKRGIPDSMVTPFLDGKALLPYSEGFIFTMGRLP